MEASVDRDGSLSTSNGVVEILMDDPIIREVALPGFDPAGDPYFYWASDGSFWLVFEFMPPSWLPEFERDELGPCRDLDKQLEKALNVPVMWYDRDLYFIETLRQDTIDLISKFLARFRELHDVS